MNVSDTAHAIPLWPEQKLAEITALGGNIPSLVMHKAKQPSGAAMIVCPGGGYVVHADHEAEPIAEWLNGLGITAFVLRYRLAPHHHHPAMLDDATRALRIVRAHAADWALDPQRVGMLGFSAGGHLTSMLSTHYQNGDPEASDTIDQVSSRPDLQVLIYPVISLKGPEGHDWCCQCLLGKEPDPAMVDFLSSHLQVTKETPPAFLMHTADDGVSCMNSLLMAEALRRAEVPFELHLYEQGGHGYGLGTNDPLVSDWPKRCAIWLERHGWTTATQ
jgi:acetyl esterase/lipase